MKTIRMIALVVIGAATWMTGPNVWGQVTINEYVDDERSATATQIADTREFVELYNAGASAVDISGWTVVTKQLQGNFNLPAGLKTYTIPAATSISAGGYYVIGAASVANVNMVLSSGGFGSGTNFFPDGADSTNGNHVLELRNSSNALVDAIGDDIFRGSERTNLTAEQLAQVGGVRGGWWGQDPSFSVSSPNSRFSLARFQNGVDTNINGRDFGMLPLTPGTSNNLPQNATHTIPDADLLVGLEQDVTDYYASFVLPRAIDPLNGDGNAINPTAIPASPQGGRAIISYDETGGGNVAYSKELVHKYDLYAYVQAGLLGTTTASDLQDSEATIYGIGTADGLFGTPDPINSLNTGTILVASSQNGSTGVGWMIERVETYNGGSPTGTTTLMLIDFGDGGDGVPEDREWEVMKSYTITTSGWVRLSIEHNSSTGVITAKKDADTIVYSVPNDFNNNNAVDAADYILWRNNSALPNEAETVGTATADDNTSWRAHFGETTKTGELGTFYVGYRENILDLSGNFSGSRPPTFDMIGGPGAFGTVPEPSALALMAIACVAMAARRGRRER